MFSRVLIANRGEIAVRIARTCRELGVSYVAVYSDVDSDARHVAMADDAIHLPGVAPVDTYLDSELILDAARRTGSEAIHPGYGFLAENANFAEAVVESGLVWIGPPADATRAVGDKIEARRIARSAGVPVVPGTLEPLADLDAVRTFADEYGYPVAIKAAGGGGGRGLKVARAEDEVAAAFESARREARAYFDSDAVYVERYLDRPKHLEVQILAPNPDEALWLGVRDCSLQRRHQKLIEETPPPRFAERASDMGAAAVSLSKACGYVNAGTVELLVEETGEFYFLEVNARLQVEHTVTEEVTGIDLVACQLKIAAGNPLGFTQDDIVWRGHSIECRINAEDPARGFVPTPGTIRRLVEPNGLGVRVDSGYSGGSQVPDAYDSLIAKLITWGEDRESARRRMLRSLDEMEVTGIATTIPAHRLLLEDREFVEGTHTTRTVEEGAALSPLMVPENEQAEADVLMVQGSSVRLWSPAMSASASAAVHEAQTAGDLVAPMQGTILKVLVAAGDEVQTGQAVVVLEAMKMENTISAPKAGVIGEVRVVAGETVGAGHVLVTLQT